MIDGGLYAQHLALLIVHFERVAVDAVANTHSFGSLFEGAGNLTLTTGWPALTKEAQHVWTGKTADRMMKKPRIKSRQALRIGEDEIGSVLALGGAPVVALSQSSADLGVQGMGSSEQLIERFGPVGVQLLVQ
jgi:hypothetical protein